jgi:hypothetical protein
MDIVGQEGVKSDYSFPPSNEVKITWSYTSVAPYVNFAFTFTVYGYIDLIFSWMFVLFHVEIYFCIYVTFVFEVGLF